MNLKKKINLIQDHIKDITPELDLKYILDHANVTKTPLTLPSRSIFRIPKMAATIGVSFIIFLGIIYLLSSNMSPLSKSNKSFDSKSDPSESAPLEYQYYGFMGVSMSTIIDNNNETNQPEIDFLSKYTKTLEVLRNVQLDSNFLKRKSDKPNYQYLIHYNTIDFLDNSLNYKIYYKYNEMLVQINDISYLLKIKEIVQNNIKIIEVQYENEESKIIVSMEINKPNTFTYEITKNNQMINKAQFIVNSGRLLKLEDITSNLVKRVYIIDNDGDSLINLNIHTLHKSEITNDYEADETSFMTINITVTSDLTNNNYIYKVKQGDMIVEYTSERD